MSGPAADVITDLITTGVTEGSVRVTGALRRGLSRLSSSRSTEVLTSTSSRRTLCNDGSSGNIESDGTRRAGSDEESEDAKGFVSNETMDGISEEADALKDNTGNRQLETTPSRATKLLVSIVFPICFLILASIISYHFTELTGIYALGTMCEEMQNSVLEQVHERLLGNMHPLRIYLQAGMAMSEEWGLNLSTWKDLQELLPYQHHFLDTYMDESRCCSGIFTNIAYDHADNANTTKKGGDGIDDVLVCHALEAPNCANSSTGSMAEEIALANLTGNAIWAGVLHYSESYTAEFRSKHGTVGGNVHHGDFVQVLPGNIEGTPNNTLTFKWYEGKSSMGPWLGDANLNFLGPNCKDRCYEDSTDDHWAQPIGFVHWPIQDGYWYRDIQLYNMQKGDVRSSPRAFPWTLYPPAVLKVHMFTPVFDREGRRIGGWVVGFKLHWLSQFLAGLKMDGDCMTAGCFCFIVERDTGNLIAASDPSVKVLTNDDTTNGMPIDMIKAVDSTDVRVSAIANKVVEEHEGSWSDVHGYKSRTEIEIDSSVVEMAIDRLTVSQPFILTSDFKRRSDEPMNSTVTDVPHGIDWIVVLTIPEELVMRGINEKKTTNSLMLIGFSIGIGVAENLWLMMFSVLVACFVGGYLAKKCLIAKNEVYSTSNSLDQESPEDNGSTGKQINCDENLNASVRCANCSSVIQAVPIEDAEIEQKRNEAACFWSLSRTWS